jgi:allophanate hydrolase subunit 2
VPGVDSGATGGYARRAHVIAIDRFLLAHARPGRARRFGAVVVDEVPALDRKLHREPYRAFAARCHRAASSARAAR